MKSKGFTLIEMIMVVTILALLSVVSIATVSKVIRDKRVVTYQAQVKSILESAIVYVRDNKLDSLPTSSNSTLTIHLSDLVDYGYIDRSIYNNTYYNSSGQKIQFSSSRTITVSLPGSVTTPTDMQTYDGNYLYTLNS